VREQLGEELEDRLSVAVRVSHEGRRAHAATGQVRNEITDALGVVADDERRDRVRAQAPSSPVSGMATRPYWPW
jgi:hypothetical protein